MNNLKRNYLVNLASAGFLLLKIVLLMLIYFEFNLNEFTTFDIMKYHLSNIFLNIKKRYRRHEYDDYDRSGRCKGIYDLTMA